METVDQELVRLRLERQAAIQEAASWWLAWRSKSNIPLEPITQEEAFKQMEDQITRIAHHK